MRQLRLVWLIRDARRLMFVQFEETTDSANWKNGEGHVIMGSIPSDPNNILYRIHDIPDLNLSTESHGHEFEVFNNHFYAFEF